MINCIENNGYVCLLNEGKMELLEFCYSNRFILIEEGNYYKVLYRINIYC